MTVTTEDELEGLKAIGRIVAQVLAAMSAAAEPGMTTRELDDMGRALLDKEGARSAPEISYKFPGATCISINEEIAHGIPGDRVIRAGDLVNIDVSAEKDGLFGDTGASFVVPPVRPDLARLCRDGKRAMWEGIRAVKSGGRLNAIGERIERFADKGGYTLIRNLSSHGVGRSLHEEPEGISTWADPSDRRVIKEGQVFTIEPFLSMGGDFAAEAGDGWTLLADPSAPTVQYEHSLVATKNGPVILTLA
ncbi:type I methionyl aminopeptidase [Parvibaculum sp.]|jgi:methionyl aminopeptidase|uniref:type I methionyl aminopeptidase n=2 Tax=Parvibaculum sp. TaxID=2024848 RepID=UPI001B0719AF|nr:type I methionyl aminopeptidase [Parvibaculum sp.]MBO6677152.1 type I methionyl aminopeptidase [Parvibaculum sp.]MBO6683888.1 type I methionyl aminopeptidase [Parvibaculum sp.]